MEYWRKLIFEAMETIDNAMDDRDMSDETFHELRDIHTKLGYIAEEE